MPRFKLTIEYHGGDYCGWPTHIAQKVRSGFAMQICGLKEKHIAQKVRSGFAMQICGIKRDADAPV